MKKEYRAPQTEAFTLVPCSLLSTSMISTNQVGNGVQLSNERSSIWDCQAEMEE